MYSYYLVHMYVCYILYVCYIIYNTLYYTISVFLLFGTYVRMLYIICMLYNL